MAGYTPVFDSVFHGTLCGRWPTLAVWLTILPLTDRYGQIDLTYQAIHALTGWPEDLLRQAIAELMQPDPESRSEVHEGRRLVLIDETNRSWGWRVVNHERYREKARKQAYDAQRTASGQDRERKADARSKSQQKRVDVQSREVPASPAPSRDLPLSDTDTDTDTNAHSKSQSAAAAAVARGVDDMLAFKLAYPDRAGGQPWRRAVKAINARLAEGHTWAEMIDGAQRYAAWCEATEKVGTEYVMQAATFVGPDKHFLQPWSFPVKQKGTDKKLTWRPSADEDEDRVPK